MKQEKTTAMKALLVEIKININKRLFLQGYITEEMYNKARDEIIRQA